jgi:glutaredoxin
MNARYFRLINPSDPSDSCDHSKHLPRILEQAEKAGFSGDLKIYDLGHDTEDSYSLVIEGTYQGQSLCVAVGYGMNRSKLAIRKWWYRRGGNQEQLQMERQVSPRRSMNARYFRLVNPSDRSDSCDHSKHLPRILEQAEKAGFSGDLKIHDLGHDTEDSYSLMVEGTYQGQPLCVAVGYGMNHSKLAIRKWWYRRGGNQEPPLWRANHDRDEAGF